MVQFVKPIMAGKEPSRRVGYCPPRLEIIERKSDVLKPSSLCCLGRAFDATINLTRGCPHRCIYCYARGYRNYPGDDRVLLYGNTVEKLRSELFRRRRLPQTVYFSSSTDAFGPYRLLQRMTYETMRMLLEHGVAVSFLTKGYIWRRFYELWRPYPRLVHAQVGLNTLNPKIARCLEPLAATPRRRLKNVQRLLAADIELTVRIDPLVPYVTDAPDQMTDLCRQLAGMGVKHLSAAYLFVRPQILRNILSDLPGTTLRRRIWEVYHAGVTVPLHGGGCAIRLPAAKYRAAGYERLRRISSRFGLRLRLCSCKNPDMNLPDKCNLAAVGSATTVPGRLPRGQQLVLFS